MCDFSGDFPEMFLMCSVCVASPMSVQDFVVLCKHRQMTFIHQVALNVKRKKARADSGKTEQRYEKRAAKRKAWEDAHPGLIPG